MLLSIYRQLNDGNGVLHMNQNRRHQGDTKTFEELTFAGQAKAINVRVVGLKRHIQAHLRRARSERRNVDQVNQKCINQIKRLLNQLS